MGKDDDLDKVAVSGAGSFLLQGGTGIRWMIARGR
jgi:hypothetical protein